MEKSIQDLTRKIDMLLTRMEEIDKKLTQDISHTTPDPILKFQIGELENLKTELQEIKKILTTSNQQVLDITIFNMLKQLESTAGEIRESIGFVKNIFIQEKVKPMKKKLPKQEAINIFLRKYVKSMK
ncbi:hypothetical protein CA265_14180 [Sphingobacteriaceae bacterium GW460-11-11-14-LB5]|nr:hypothetical protein CA265_14180 [Sphingobacteriaceae bacterium GW460-11-11-14-LB5]